MSPDPGLMDELKRRIAELEDERDRLAADGAALRQQLCETQEALHRKEQELAAESRKSEEMSAMAEGVSRAKNDFLANMSHEFRTPLNGVIAAADLALGETPSSKVEHYLKMIHTSGSSLLNIVNEILDFSKIEAGQFDLEPRPFRLDEILDSLSDMYSAKAFKKKIELLVDVEPEIPKALVGDALRLHQVLATFIDNALKFTHRGGIVTVGVRDVDIGADAVTYEIYVKDTGVGMAPEHLELIFQPFSQLDPSATRKYEGTGLGLCFAQKLVESMGGKIKVKSAPNQGSTFSFQVRLVRQPPDQEARYTFPADLEGLNVLMVDDSRDSREVLKKMMDAFGFQVKAVSSGLEALDYLKTIDPANPVDLIVLDWKMPEMDGNQTAQRIRRELKLDTPIIMLTAVGGETERIDAQHVGIEAFLKKPADAPSLFNTVIDVIGKGALESERQKKYISTKASIYKKRLIGVRVLVAEDNPTNQEIAQAVLESARIAVEIVANGQEALSALEQRDYDAVLMDIQMPVMDGLEATRRIRQTPRFRDLPVIAMTAHAMQGDEEACLLAGMNGYVTKPINQDVLFYTLWKKIKFKDAAAMSYKPGTEKEAAADELVDEHGDLPDSLPGIDIHDALCALNIERATFRRILLGFLRNNRHILSHIQDAYDAGDMEALRSLAHSLKGSSANIGANDLKEAAWQLEKASKTGTIEAVKPELITGLGACLKQVMASLALLEEPARTGSRERSPADPETIAPLLRQLAKAIATSDPDEINKYAAAVKRRTGTEKLQDLQEKLDDYDYDEALEALKVLAGEMQIKWEATDE